MHSTLALRAAVTIILSALVGNAQGPLRGSSDLLARVDGAVNAWAKSNSTFVTPRLIPELMNATGQFQTVYCYPSNPQSVRTQCEKLLSSDIQYNSTVVIFLNQLLGLPKTEIKSLFGLLPAEVGSTAEASGWPETQPNRFWSLEIPFAHSNLTVDVNGTPQGAGGVRTVILPAGTTGLLARLVDGRQVSMTAAGIPGTGPPRITTALANASPALAATPTIIEPDISAYCQPSTRWQ